MSKNSIVTVKTIGIKDAFGKGRPGVCYYGVRKEDVLDIVKDLLNKGESFYVDCEEMELEKYVKLNYENMSYTELSDLEREFNVLLA